MQREWKGDREGAPQSTAGQLPGPPGTACGIAMASRALATTDACSVCRSWRCQSQCTCTVPATTSAPCEAEGQASHASAHHTYIRIRIDIDIVTSCQTELL